MKKQLQLILPLLLCLLGQNAFGQMPSRLIKTYFYDHYKNNSGLPNDIFYYHYTTNPPDKYEELIHTSITPNYSYKTLYTIRQYFDKKNPSLVVYNITYNDNAFTDTSTKNVYIYDSLGRVTSEGYYTKASPTKPMENFLNIWSSYKINNLLLSKTFDYHTLLAREAHYYDYNTQQQLIADSIHYSSYQMPQGNATKKYTYQYGANGKLKEMILQRWENGWADREKTTYQYNVLGQLVANIMYQMDANKNWEYLQIYQMSYDQKGRIKDSIDLRHNRTTNTFEPFTKCTWQYNNDNLPTEYTYAVADSVLGWKKSFTYKYFYEKYWPAKVHTVVNNVDQIKLYPNPAINELHISCKRPQAKPLTVAIYNMRGQMVKHWVEEPTDTYQKTLATDALDAGHYILVLQGSAERTTAQFTVVH